jgi:hypothetical protein
MFVRLSPAAHQCRHRSASSSLIPYIEDQKQQVPGEYKIVEYEASVQGATNRTLHYHLLLSWST